MLEPFFLLHPPPPPSRSRRLDLLICTLLRMVRLLLQSIPWLLSSTGHHAMLAGLAGWIWNGTEWNGNVAPVLDMGVDMDTDMDMNVDRGVIRCFSKDVPFVTVVTDLGSAHPTWFDPRVSEKRCVCVCVSILCTRTRRSPLLLFLFLVSMLRLKGGWMFFFFFF